MKTNKDTSEAKLKNGNENYGYSADEPKTKQVASSPPTSSEFRVPEQRSNSRPYQESAQQRQGPAKQPRVSFPMASPMKIRNVTLV